MLRTTTIFYASTAVLIALLLLCIYLLVQNYRAKKEAQYKLVFNEHIQPQWDSAIFDGKAPEIQLKSTREAEWTAEYFLHLYHFYCDPNIRSRISALSDEYLSSFIAPLLSSWRETNRQYGLVIHRQLHMSTHATEASAIALRSDLDVLTKGK